MTLLLAALLALAPAASAAPRLLVVVSVDQMRAEYLTLPHAAGLERLSSEGFVFENAAHTHVPTETGPGHATILTGRLPGTHGIVGNDWYDRALGTTTYCVADSVHGRGPEHLWAYTLGDALKARDPESKVVSVSLKDRAAILLGGKRPDVVVWYDSWKGRFKSSTYYGAEPRWLSAFNERIREKGEPLAQDTTTWFREIRRSPEADRMVLALALEALKREKLGRDEHPDVLAVSFSATDYVGHRFGPDSPEMKAQLERLDAFLGQLLDGLDDRVGKGRYDVALTADHGAHPHPRAGKRVLWDDVTEQVEKALQYDFPAKGRWLLDNDFPNFYLNRAQAESIGLDWRAFLRQAARRLELSVPGLERVFVADDLDRADPYYGVYARSVAIGRSGDLIARPARDLIVADPEDVGEHGTPYEYDARVPLLVWGPDFKTGRSTETVRVADLAPTLGAALGVDFKPEADSRVLPALK